MILCKTIFKASVSCMQNQNRVSFIDPLRSCINVVDKIIRNSIRVGNARSASEFAAASAERCASSETVRHAQCGTITFSLFTPAAAAIHT